MSDSGLSRVPYHVSVLTSLLRGSGSQPRPDEDPLPPEVLSAIAGNEGDDHVKEIDPAHGGLAEVTAQTTAEQMAVQEPDLDGAAPNQLHAYLLRRVGTENSAENQVNRRMPRASRPPCLISYGCSK